MGIKNGIRWLYSILFWGGCLLNAVPAWAQPDPALYPVIVFESAHWSGMIPTGWVAVQQDEVDFNEDKSKDIALVIEKEQPDQWKNKKGEWVSGHMRILFLAMKQRPKGFYRLIEQTNTFIPPRLTNKPDDWKSMQFHRTHLLLDFINHKKSNNNYRETVQYVFRFELARFYLVQAQLTAENLKEGTYTVHHFNFPNWKVAIRKGNEEEGDTLIQWKLLPRMMLKHFGGFPRPFTWPVMEGVVL